MYAFTRNNFQKGNLHDKITKPTSGISQQFFIVKLAVLVIVNHQGEKGLRHQWENFNINTHIHIKYDQKSVLM